MRIEYVRLLDPVFPYDTKRTQIEFVLKNRNSHEVIINKPAPDSLYKVLQEFSVCAATDYKRSSRPFKIVNFVRFKPHLHGYRLQVQLSGVSYPYASCVTTDSYPHNVKELYETVQTEAKEFVIENTKIDWRTE